MVKLITPPGMLLTVALLFIYAVYAFMIGAIERSWALKSAGTAALIATYGVAMLRPWSRYLVFALTAGFFLKLGISIYEGMVSGFFSFQFGAPLEIARSMAPTMAMAVLSGVCCVLVYRYFRSTRSCEPYK